MHAAIITDFTCAVYAMVITDLSGPMDPMVIAYFACTMNTMIVASFGVGTIASRRGVVAGMARTMVAAAVATVSTAATATVATTATATVATTAAATVATAIAASAIATAAAASTAAPTISASTTATTSAAATASSTPTATFLGLNAGHPGQVVRDQYGGRRQDCADGHCEHELLNVHIVLRLCCLGWERGCALFACDPTRSRGQWMLEASSKIGMYIRITMTPINRPMKVMSSGSNSRTNHSIQRLISSS